MESSSDDDYPTFVLEDKEYLTVPQLVNDNCAMCIGGSSINCHALPGCRGVVFIEREQLPEYHVRYLAARWTS